MITIRYPTGLTITYRQANYLIHGDGNWLLYTRKDGDFVAAIQKSAGVVADLGTACLTENKGQGARDIINQLACNPELLRDGHGRDLHALKNILAGFDARQYRWK